MLGVIGIATIVSVGKVIAAVALVVAVCATVILFSSTSSFFVVHSLVPSLFWSLFLTCHFGRYVLSRPNL